MGRCKFSCHTKPSCHWIFGRNCEACQIACRPQEQTGFDRHEGVAVISFRINKTLGRSPIRAGQSGLKGDGGSPQMFTDEEEARIQ